MAKKKGRISKDAFDWVQNTDSEAKPLKKSKKVVQKGKIKKADEPRAIAVKYLTSDGTIIAMQERKISASFYWLKSVNDKIADFKLSEIPEKTLYEIHTQYRVDVPTEKLVPIAQ